ncbi:GPI ethanolamine phosphate transferas-like protein [Calycina marina]|uniref:GPI ethanolamine phosphate transferase 1 n=1 Tax=Calycina marina TaxID=1763456 RepID=A0A9P8CE76_9HELO|nr:GPI ethanolamine phosphate transferas-like protein [Calycina marina]
MPRINRIGFLAIAITFHVVYIFSIFDIYFVSPVVSGMQEFEVTRPDNIEAPANRLVLFVGDGLRADKAFQSHPEPYPSNDADLIPRPLAPFLRSRALSHGTFGVSHTRVPTESRPGHVALIAGLYEDVSAVTTGWKLNPVNFDSVFNRSQHTWSWGSPDILPMFEKGAVDGRVDAFTYGAEEEDATKNAEQLDHWVFDGVKKLFADAATNATLDAQLRQKKLVFFLHLLGLDTNGHAYRPYSKEYLHNIKIVDQGVKEISETIERFYDDGKTAFVFTADHGMSDWGSHGDGHPDNTRTPLIAWGSGIAKPVVTKEGIAPGHDVLSADWGLDCVTRHDVSQADVAALMAYLAGLAFPVNSVGELPLSFLSGDLAAKSEAFLANAKGILEMYRVKEEQKKATELRYRPFKTLGEAATVSHRFEEIKALIDEGEHDEAIKRTGEMLNHGLQGLRYLQRYDWLFLRALITLGYLGWVAFGLTTVIDLHVLHGRTETSRTLGGKVFFSSVLVLMYSSFIISKSPLTYYAYAIFPVGFWEEVYARRNSLLEGKRALFGQVTTAGGHAVLISKAVIFVALIESLALGYTHREVFSVLFLAAATWPVFYGTRFVKDNSFLVGTWMVSCGVMSTFTLMPAIKTENVFLILLGGSIMVLIGVLYLICERNLLAKSKFPGDFTNPADSSISRILLGVQIGFIAMAMIVTQSSVVSLQAKLGLPRGNQIVGWLVLILPFFMPFLHRFQPNNHFLQRLIIIFLTFSPLFVILTISFEGIFYLGFSITLITWVHLEHAVYKATLQSTLANQPSAALPSSLSPSPYRSLTLADLRTALFFLTLLQSAFFSTGNVASISSFSLDSVYRLVPVFDPFSQGALLFLKLMVPFALISANLGILNKRLGVAPSALFMLVMALGDMLTLHFFWVVRDEGSWLEIGSTISHFCIASLLCVFVAGLEGVSEVFIQGVEVEVPAQVEKEKELGGLVQMSSGQIKVTTVDGKEGSEIIRKPVGDKRKATT